MPIHTPIYHTHVNLEGKMVSYAGYYLPIQYPTGIVKEHIAVREGVGIFDVSHMGEILVRGKDALENVSYFVTNAMKDLQIGRIRYSPMCNKNGGIIDDLLVYRMGLEEYMLVVNASNKDKDYVHMKENSFGDVEIKDCSSEIGQIALQGRAASLILKELLESKDLPDKYYSFKNNIGIDNIKCLISKTGYTGEEGYEIYFPWDQGKELYHRFMEVGMKYDITPCGLGARDTLRLEAGMPLYGHEMTDVISPYDTGLDNFVKLEDHNFIGKEALVTSPKDKNRIGLLILGKGIARANYDVYKNDVKIGYITSGTYSPYSKEAIAMAIVKKEYSEIDTILYVKIREIMVEAKVVKIPFYNRNKK